MNTQYAHCEEIREEFSALLDNELGADERDAIEDHLGECSDCLRALDRMKRVDDMFSRLEMKSAPDGFEAGVHKKLEGNVVRFPWRSFGASLVAAAAAVVLVVSLWPERTQLSDGRFRMAQTPNEAEQAQAADTPAPSEPVSEARNEAGYSERFDEVTQQSEPASPAADATQFDSDGAAVTEGQMLEEEPVREPAGRRTDEHLEDAETLSVGEIDETEAPSPESAAFRSFDDAAEFEAESTEQEALQEPADRESDARNAATGAEPSAAEDTALAQPPVQSAPRSAEAAPGSSDTVSRSFEVRDGVWYETGYADDPVTEIGRDSDKAAELIEGDPSVSELLANSARCVFQVDGAWYAFPAAK